MGYQQRRNDLIHSKLLTVEGVSRRVLQKQPTIRGWLRTGKLKGIKLPGGDWRIREDDLEAILLPTKTSA